MLTMAVDQLVITLYPPTSLTYSTPHQIWSGKTFACLKTLAGHEGKIMCVDVAPDGSNMLASVSYDRTMKMWAPDEAPAVV